MTNKVVTGIYSFLVKPKVSGKTVKPLGTVVGLSGPLFDLLNGIFQKAEEECSIDIAFKMGEDGTQKNAVKQMLLDHLHASGAKNRAATAAKIADRLADFTTHVSGSGLLFVICGKYGNKPAIVLSRFPADEGIVADDKFSTLTVEFVDKLFMKDRRSYKAVVFTNMVPGTSRRTGRAVDKQINDVMNPTSKYWIHDVLSCDFTVTSAAGSKRFAEALKYATNNTDDFEVKAKIAGAAMLMSNFDGKLMSAKKLLDSLNMPKAAIDAVTDKIGQAAMAETFKFNSSIFGGHYKFRTKVLDNGAVLTAEAQAYDEIFQQEEQSDGQVMYTTTGNLLKERIGKQKYGAS